AGHPDQRRATGVLHEAERASARAAAGRLADLPALARGQLARAIPVVAVRAGELRLLFHQAARRGGDAAALEAVRALGRSRPRRGGGRGLGAERVGAAEQGACRGEVARSGGGDETAQQNDAWAWRAMLVG